MVREKKRSHPGAPAMREWESEDIEPDRLWGRVAITEPGAARTVEVDTPSGWTNRVKVIE